MDKNSKSEPGERYTSLGVSFSMIDKVKKEEEKAHSQLQMKLENVVQSGVVQNCKIFFLTNFILRVLISKNFIAALKTKEFVFIAFNYFCRDTLGNYIPAEIGIIKFTLLDGVQYNKLHLMINPSKKPRFQNFHIS